MKTAVCVFGVNGVGKSSVLRGLGTLLPEVKVLHGSSILKETMGVASYQELEAKSAARKKLAYIAGLRNALASLASGIVLVDTHLVVSIWGPDKRRIEDMWHDELVDLFDGFVYITARSRSVSERRQHDLVNQLRLRQAAEVDCQHDLSVNDTRWDTVSAKCSQTCVIVNDTSLELAASKLKNFVWSLRYSGCSCQQE